MTENVSDLVLEGNATVALVQELFIARAECEPCDSIEDIALCIRMRLQWEQF